MKPNKKLIKIIKSKMSEREIKDMCNYIKHQKKNEMFGIILYRVHHGQLIIKFLFGNQDVDYKEIRTRFTDKELGMNIYLQDNTKVDKVLSSNPCGWGSL